MATIETRRSADGKTGSIKSRQTQAS